MSQRGRN